MTPWTAARQASLSFIISRNLLKFMSFESVIPSNHRILYHLLLLLLSVFPSIKVFSQSWLFASGGQSTGASTSASVLPVINSELISFRIDWFALFDFQGMLKSFLQHHNSKASILWCSAFFMIQLTAVPDSWKKHSFD